MGGLLESGWFHIHRVGGVDDPILQRGNIDGDIGETRLVHEENRGRGQDAATTVAHGAGMAVAVMHGRQLIVR